MYATFASLSTQGREVTGRIVCQEHMILGLNVDGMNYTFTRNPENRQLWKLVGEMGSWMRVS